MKRSAAALITLALAMATAWLIGRAVVRPLGDAIARQIGVVAAALPAPIDSTLEAAVPFATPSEVPAAEAPAPAPNPATASPRSPSMRHIARSPAAPPAPRSPPVTTTVEIPAERLAPLTEKQLRRLGAVDAMGADGRRMGAALVGFGALGLGLDDGDVVTSIDGQSTPDVDSALAAAVKSYGSGEDRIRATVMRGGRSLAVLVHVPRPAGGTPPH